MREVCVKMNESKVYCMCVDLFAVSLWIFEEKTPINKNYSILLI